MADVIGEHGERGGVKGGVVFEGLVQPGSAASIVALLTRSADRKCS